VKGHTFKCSGKRRQAFAIRHKQMQIEREALSGFDGSAIQRLRAQNKGPGRIGKSARALILLRTKITIVIAQREAERTPQLVRRYCREPDAFFGPKRKAVRRHEELPHLGNEQLTWPLGGGLHSAQRLSAAELADLKIRAG
jgi:hypothetical protein